MMAITGHKAAAIARLLEQYRDKPGIRSLISDFVGEMQTVEDATFSLISGRWVNVASGATLDLVGDIVGAFRAPGQDDAAYRIDIQTKISENVSEGEPERIIEAFRIMTGAALVYLADGSRGEVGLMSEQELDQDTANILYPAIKKILGATVRVESLGMFDVEEPFALSGSLFGRGFGSTTDLTQGGKLAKIFRPNNIKLAFGGVLFVGLGGLGTITDPIVGGVFEE